MQEPKSTAPSTSADNGAAASDNTSTQETPQSKSARQREVETDTAMFTAVGIILGEVNFTEDNKATVALGSKQYQLFYTKKNYLAYTGLQKEIEATNNNTKRLIVYPRMMHFPSRDEAPRLSFQLVGFDKGNHPGIAGELKNNEFKLCGLWQFIPVCRTPCVSIFRNFNKERLDYVKQADPTTKTRFMKASHIPLLWRDAPVRPFRFNPKAGKDQGHPSFISVKAKFIPSRDAWGFVEELAEYREKAPRFLKVSKKDKALAQKGSTKDKAAQKGSKKDKAAPKGNVPKKEFKDLMKPTKKPVKKVTVD